MNDRLKFRVWNPDMESYDDDPQYNVDIKIDQENGLVLTPFHNNIIEFCTGLKDKNGNLIYEGDLLEAGGHRYVVCWAHHGFVMRVTPDSASSYPLGPSLFEIIGNIHQN